jgi:flagellar motor switch protein FliN/FliY
MTKPKENDDIYTAAEEDPASAPSPSQSAALLSLPVSVAVSVGRVKASIEQLLAAGPDAILTLDTKLDDPVELIIGDQVIARGRLIELNDGAAVGVEIAEVLQTTDRP